MTIKFREYGSVGHSALAFTHYGWFYHDNWIYYLTTGRRLWRTDPHNEVVTQIVSADIGATIGPIYNPYNDRIYCVPFGTTGSDERQIKEVNRVTGAVSNVGALYGTTYAYKFRSAVVAPSGKVVLIPYNYNRVSIYNPDTTSWTDIGASDTTAAKFFGGVLAPNGKIFTIAYNRPRIWEIDPEAGTVDVHTFSQTVGTSMAYWDAVLDKNGNIWFIPYNSNHFIKLNPNTLAQSSTYYAGNDKWIGAVVTPSGLIYTIPAQRNYVARINPDTDDISYGYLASSDVYPFAGGGYGPDGNVYLIPAQINRIYRVKVHPVDFDIDFITHNKSYNNVAQDPARYLPVGLAGADGNFVKAGASGFRSVASAGRPRSDTNRTRFATLHTAGGSLVSTYSGLNNRTDTALGIVLGRDNIAYICGERWNPTTDTRTRFSKLDHRFNEEWGTYTGASVWWGVATDRYENGYAVDGNGFIYKYDTNGNQLWSVRPGGLTATKWSVDVDKHGNVYATARSNIFKVNSNGDSLWIENVNNAGSAKIDASGYIYVAESGNLRTLLSNGNLIDEFSIGSSSYSTGTTGARPDVSIDNEFIYVSRGNRYFNKFDLEGNQIFQVYTNFSAVHSISVDDLQNIYVSGSYRTSTDNQVLLCFDESGDEVWRYNADGSSSEELKTTVDTQPGRVGAFYDFDDIGPVWQEKQLRPILPVADANGPYNIARGYDPTPNTVTLTGEGSHKVDGSISHYRWYVNDITSGNKVADVTTESTNVSYDTFTSKGLTNNNTYPLFLVVEDNEGILSEPSETTITLNNTLPTVSINAPNPNYLFSTESSTLSGSASDPDGTVEAYRWYAKGPNESSPGRIILTNTGVSGGSINISDSVSYATIKGAQPDGTFEIRLQAQDNDGDWSTISAAQNINLYTPTVNAGGPYGPIAHTQHPSLPTSVQLAGSGQDVDTYQWYVVVGATEYAISGKTSPTSTVSYSEIVALSPGNGTKTLRLKGTKLHQTVSDDTTIELANTLPIATITSVVPDSIAFDDTMTLNASDSVDYDGTIERYYWYVANSEIEVKDTTDAIDTVTYSELRTKGLGNTTYDLYLKVEDNDSGESAPTSTPITLNNTKPVADANGPYEVSPGETVQLDGSGSSHYEGSIAQWKWYIGSIDHPTDLQLIATGENPTVSYDTIIAKTPNIGEANLYLIVQDDDEHDPLWSDPDQTTILIDLLQPEGGVEIGGTSFANASMTDYLASGAMILGFAADTEYDWKVDVVSELNLLFSGYSIAYFDIKFISTKMLRGVFSIDGNIYFLPNESSNVKVFGLGFEPLDERMVLSRFLK